MKNIQLYIIIFLLLSNKAICQDSNTDSCTFYHGNSIYQLHSYTCKYNNKIFDTISVIKRHFRQSFCSNTDTVFLKSLKSKLNSTYEILPIIINLENCDGLYAYIYHSGWFNANESSLQKIHFFLVSKGNVFYLNRIYDDDDDAKQKVIKLIEKEKPHLLTMYNGEDIELINIYANRSFLVVDLAKCLTPMRIYKGSKLYLNGIKSY